MQLDRDYVASIASGGLGKWVHDNNGALAYVKHEDCIGGSITLPHPFLIVCCAQTACPDAVASLLDEITPVEGSMVAGGNLQPPIHRSPTPLCASWTHGSAGCLKDLQAMLRGDDEEERPAFFAISQFNLARSDLVPLITTYPDDHEVVYNAREWGSGE